MKAICVFAIFVCVPAVAAFGASDPATRTDFTGTDTGLGALPPPPTMTTQGNTVHIRGLNGFSHVVLAATDGSPFFDGTIYFTFTSNWVLPDYTGPVSGTFRMVDTAGNAVEFVCHGLRSVVSPGTWQTVDHCTGIGVGGKFDGNPFQLTETVTTHAPFPPPRFAGEITGSMLEPASQNQ